ncbi:MAG: hypothetical protein Q9167_002307 [Letrouitia subvulpina]
MDEGVTTPGSWARGGSYPGQHGFGQSHGTAGNIGSHTDTFFVPTYLRGSKFIEKLEAANEARHEARLAAQRQAPAAHPPGNGSLSSRSSSVSLHKLVPSHRGVSYEIIEHQPPEVYAGYPPLPSRWVDTDKHGIIKISADGLEVRSEGGVKLQDHEAAAARTDYPMPPQCGIYYYEVTILAKGKEGMIGIGFCGPNVPLERFPGWEPESWAWHGDDGNSFCCQMIGRKYGPTFTTGDIVGCGVNFMTHSAFFTKNGNFQGNAFKDLKEGVIYPSVGMKHPQAHLSINFGQRPFIYDIDDMVARQKSDIEDEINRASIVSLRPDLDESALVKELVAQYLTHDGFVETAKAFASELRVEAGPLQNDLPTSLGDSLMQEDLDAANRQQIRAAIMEGDIDRALKRTHAFYPQVLQNHSQVYFRLRCRKFVEMIHQTAELLGKSIPKAPSSKASNGHSSITKALEGDNYAHSEMDLDPDDEKSADPAYDWDKMETEDSEIHARYQNKLEETLEYGRELKHEFQDDKSTESAFKEIFSLFMYEDPRQSPQAHLLDRAGRVPVAEELNSAILVSLGKSSSAAIERLYQQTEVLVDEISEEGGAGAFINVRNDFLRLAD